MKNKIEKMIKNYIQEEIKKAKKENRKTVELKNVYPSILEDVIGSFNEPYELNGYDCDYWVQTSEFEISGCMRFGTADLTFKNFKEKKEEEKIEISEEEKRQQKVKNEYKDLYVIKNYDEKEHKNMIKDFKDFYVSFGCGQMYAERYQNIKAKNRTDAIRAVNILYGTRYCMVYNQEEWNKINPVCWLGNLQPIIVFRNGLLDPIDFY